MGHFFPQQIFFSWVGIDVISETDYKKPNSPKFSANTVLVGGKPINIRLLVATDTNRLNVTTNRGGADKMGG